MKLALWSPLPPAKTGTASYTIKLLNSIAWNRANQIDIIVEDRFFSTSTLDDSRVRIRKASEALSEAYDVNLFTIANNLFHSYCLKELMRSRSFQSSFNVVLLHEPGILMHVAELIRSGQIGADILGYDSVCMKGWLPNKIMDQTLPKPAIYQLMCSGIYSHVQLLVTHSYYAARRLQLETASSFKLPKILVMRHPPCDQPSGQGKDFERDDRFVVGVFGAIAESKRPDTIVHAFSKFVKLIQTRYNIGNPKLRLIFVGQVSSKSHDPFMLARKYDIADRVTAHGYVKDDEMHRLIGTVSLMVNLRFPSCGETSGTQSLGFDFQTPCITSRYQAFYEEPSYGKVSINNEIHDLVSLMHQRWADMFVELSPKPQKLSDERYTKFSAMDTFELILREASSYKKGVS